MDLAAALRYLDEHVNLEAVVADRHSHPTLERMQRLMHVLGDPQQAAPLVHITGTNGKGSTAQIATRLLEAHGLTVGTYTSPHLQRINERIAVNGFPITDEEFGEAIRGVADAEALAGVEPSYFEILTAAAYRWFADIAVDVVVVGGRPARPLGRHERRRRSGCHRHQRRARPHGVRRPDPSRHRAREGRHREARRVVDPRRDRSRARAGVPRRSNRARRSFATSTSRATTTCSLSGGGCSSCALRARRTPTSSSHCTARIRATTPRLHSPRSRRSSAQPLAPELVTAGFDNVVMPGRFEIVGRHPLVVLDGAHNPAGADVAAAVVDEEFSEVDERIYVIGMLRGRDPVAMLEAIDAASARLVIATAPATSRAVPAEDIAPRRDVARHRRRGRRGSRRRRATGARRGPDRRPRAHHRIALRGRRGSKPSRPLTDPTCTLAAHGSHTGHREARRGRAWSRR